MEHFLWINDQQAGPFDEPTIADMIRGGRVTADTLIYIAQVADWKPAHTILPADLFAPRNPPSTNPNAMLPPPLPPVIPVEPLWYGRAESVIHVRMTSGETFSIKQVRLYDEAKLQSVAARKAAAMEMFSGVKDPYASIGSVPWVVITSTLSRALETTFSQKQAKEGFQLLQEIGREEKALRAEASFFPVGQIQDAEHPIPSLWRAQSDKAGYVHEGGEFVSVKDPQDKLWSLRWGAVESFDYRAAG